MSLSGIDWGKLIKLVVVAVGTGVLMILAVELILFSLWLGDYVGMFI